MTGTKTRDAWDLVKSQSALWVRNNETGYVTFNATARGWPITPPVLPSTGVVQVEFAPDKSLCLENRRRCITGALDLNAESPFPCPLGYYCKSGVATDIPVPKNFSTPQRCFDGFFCPRGSESPEGSGACPTGYFCPSQTEAIICPRGFYCPGVANPNPVECYPGTYNPSLGQSNCTLCPTGHICPGWGRLRPELCPSGFVCISLGLSAPVLQCPQGFWCGEGTMTLNAGDTTEFRPFPCPPGTFCLGGVAHNITIDWIPSHAYGATAPQTCYYGQYCEFASTSAYGSGPCFPGHYCPPGSEWPTETPQGRFSGTTGAVAPSLCFPGTYSALPGTIECRPCPSGYSCQNYGTYEPEICPEGMYRSAADSVTCKFCPTGTYSSERGNSDLSYCLPCPPGRVCGGTGMTTLADSVPCAEGYACGAGTDRNSMFTHKCPAGYYCYQETVPEEQYDFMCPQGFYCEKGTPFYLSTRDKCAIGYFCPNATSYGESPDIRCPRLTTTASGAYNMLQCQISPAEVCDKWDINPFNPWEDRTYYQQMQYQLLDGSDTEIKFDSTTSVGATGEIQVVEKILPINETGSVSYYVNDTVEVFRTCPMYGKASQAQPVTVIGRNFRNTTLNFCRITLCRGSDLGPMNCFNSDGTLGTLSNFTQIIPAKVQSKTRVVCEFPALQYTTNWTTGFSTDYGTCGIVNGNMTYTRLNDDGVTYDYLTSLYVDCNYAEKLYGFCQNQPEQDMKLNPCLIGQLLVEVSNNGAKFSADGLFYAHTVLDTSMYYAHVDFTVSPTYTVYSYVAGKYYPRDPLLVQMDRNLCERLMWAEEGVRAREEGWFLLTAMQQARISIDLRHLPDDFLYDEHFKIGIFTRPSRCNIQKCDSARNRLVPPEYLPCSLPMDLPRWLTDTTVKKQQVVNITMLALDDMIFKIEIHLLHGLFYAFKDFLINTTVVEVIRPERANSTLGVTDPGFRQLSPFVSYEEQDVFMEYFFVALYQYGDTASVSAPLNLPPRYSDYEKGRALLGFNTTIVNTGTPTILDPFSSVVRGSSFLSP
jgi:hypothetical protein